ncbi:MAG: hypothetical protein ABIK31_07510 [candidate division WOR-3 bacterium]
MVQQNLFEELKRGDIREIAQMTGYSWKAVWAQLKGVRTLKPKVQHAAELIIAARKEATKKYNETNQNTGSRAFKKNNV